MAWKTIGDARREERGEKKVVRYLTFSLRKFRQNADEIGACLHTHECKNIKAHLHEDHHLIRFVKKLVDWADKFEGDIVVSHKLGRGAWIKVRVIHRCSLCFGGNDERTDA